MRKRKIQKIEGPVFGQKRENSMIFKISGNWAYRPTMFYSTRLENAKATADNIEASLYVWNEETKEWMIVIDRDLVWEIGDESDENGDLALQNLDYDLRKAGFDISFEKLCKRKGRIIESAYQEWRREDIPKGAYELVPGIFI